MSGINITRIEAKERADHLYVTSYDVTLDVTTGEDGFYAKSEVDFSCTTPGYSTFIDACGSRVISATLNGAAVDTTNFDGESIFLTNLTAQNHLVIEIEGVYSKSGEGLQRSVDPSDGEVYLYSQGETAYIRHMFPCFDQPSLKATFALTVKTPSTWEAISNNPVASKESTGDITVWKFRTTPRIPLYLAALIAGPYSHVHDLYKGGKEVPLGIYCRKSMAQYLDSDDIFLLTKQGFAYFEKIFGLVYPFDKYDQIAVVDFNFGAMENAGAVTFREDLLVFRSHMPEKMYMSRANVILHEMVHMWFGDLVTMSWWDDLWLNESFAEFMAYLAMAEGTRFKGGWAGFNSERKNWAYRQDQLSSTHPIVADMVDIEAVNANFDGITYAKGASVLQQLVAHVGRENFVAGIQKYFAQHAWGNTTLKDLFDQLEATSGRSLDAWAATWLQTAGVNTLHPELTIEGDRYTSVVIKQDAPLIPAGSRELRPHRLAVGLYDIENGALILRRSVELDVAGERTTVPALVGEKTADLLLINDRDLSYAKLRFDSRSLTTLKTHLGKVSDPLTRALCWATVWDMHRDGEISSHDFLDIAFAGIPGENDDAVVSITLSQMYTSVEAYSRDEKRPAMRLKLADGLDALTKSAAPGSDLQLLFARAFAQNAITPAHIESVRALLNGSVDGLIVDADQRWFFIIALAERGAIDKSEIDAELVRDNTTSGNCFYETAVAAAPTPAAKDYAWNKIVNDDIQTSLRSALVAGFQRPIQREILSNYVDRYFDCIIDVWNSKSYEGAAKIVSGLYPTWVVSQATIDKTTTWLHTTGKDSPAVLRKLVIEAHDGLVRALKVQGAIN
ncbi:MAG: aminopeptidase N [Actinomycetota bacterium]|nr:aminopeptidase N [Actinomycetota bacterium]